VLVGVGALTLLSPTPSVATVAITCFVTGMGMGLVATPSLIAAQASVEWHERGVATGTNMFARSMGSALGAAVLGAIANGVIAGSGRPPTDPVAATAAGTAVFIGVFVAAVLTVVAGLLMPNVSAPVATDQPAPRDAEAATG
jgi:MFS family permease